MKNQATALEAAHEAARRKREAGEFVKEFNLVRRAHANPNSKVRAIAAMCFQCMGGTGTTMPDPGWKHMIRTCTSTTCALYGHRPYKAHMTTTAQEK